MYRLYKATILLVFLLPVVLGTCAPDCTGKNPGDKVEDPKNCTNYYLCIGDGQPTDASVPCSSGDEFDATASECATPAEGATPCNPSCEPPDCHMTCSSSALEYIRNPLNCGEYYVCSYGAVVSTLTCSPPTSYFDGTKCVADQTVCCTDLCTPYCYADVVQAPDPTDCTAFYICLSEGLAEETYHNKCPANTYFDIPSGRCLEGVECVTLCGAGGKTDGATDISMVTSTAASTATGTATDTTDNTDISTPASTTTTAPGGCVEQFTCTSEGAFPRCKSCNSSYFLCGGPGEQGTLQSCMQGFLFNTNPDLPYCVTADSCPYYPPR